MTGWIKESAMLLDSKTVLSYEAVVREMYRAMDSREVLEAALKRLSDGWTRGALEVGESVCILGGLNYATTGSAQVSAVNLQNRHAQGYIDACKALRAALLELAEESDYFGMPDRAALRALLTSRYKSDVEIAEEVIPFFNDILAQSYEDVAQLMKRAINHAEKEEDSAE